MFPTRRKTSLSTARTEPDSVGVHHGGFWSRRRRFKSDSGYSLFKRIQFQVLKRLRTELAKLE